MKIFLPLILLLLLVGCSDNGTGPAASVPTGWDTVASGTGLHLTDVQFVDREHGWITCVFDTILRTTDGGATWTRHSYRPAGKESYAMEKIHFIDRNEGWGVGYWNGGLLHTTDGGITWTQMEYGSAYRFSQMGCIQFFDSRHGWFGAGSIGGIVTTSDGGATWSRYEIDRGYDAQIVRMAFTSPWNGWIVGGFRTIDDSVVGLLLHTTDGGATWDSTSLDRAFHRIAFVDSTNGWLAGPVAMLHTTDGGRSWRKQNPGVPTAIKEIHFVDRSNGWLILQLPNVMYGGGAYDVLMRSTDAGEHWSNVAQKVRLTRNTDLEAISFTDPLNGWAVGTNGVIWHTTTGGVAP